MAGGYTAEVKFVVDAAVGHAIAAWVREHTSADEHGTGAFGDEYRVTSLYLDTPSADVYHRRGSFGRSKYRIRSYQDGSAVFVERKLRTASLLVKRRTPIGAATLVRLAAGPLDEGDPARWFDRRLRLRALGPVCQVRYLRIARHVPAAGGLARLTLDRDLTAVPAASYGFVDAEGAALLPGQMILEIKYRSHIPAAFKGLVGRFQLNPQPASKYRLAAGALGIVGVHA